MERWLAFRALIEPELAWRRRIEPGEDCRPTFLSRHERGWKPAKVKAWKKMGKAKWE